MVRAGGVSFWALKESSESCWVVAAGVGGTGARIGSGAGGDTAARTRGKAGSGEIARGGEPAAREGSVASREVAEGLDVEGGSAAGGIVVSPELAGAA